MVTKFERGKPRVNMGDRVYCTQCLWTGLRSECGFGHDDFYCPSCGKEGYIEKTIAQLMLDAMEREASMKPGIEGIAHWTNCGHYYQTTVRVKTVNAKSLGVEIIKPLDGYPAGWTLNIPRVLDLRRWSANNRLEVLN